MIERRDPPARGPVLLWTGVILTLLVLTVASLRSYRDLAAQRAEQRRLEADIADTRERIEELKTSIKRLKTDPAALERVARGELGMVRPGDVVIVFPEEEADGESDAAAAPPAER